MGTGFPVRPHILYAPRPCIVAEYHVHRHRNIKRDDVLSSGASLRRPVFASTHKLSKRALVACQLHPDPPRDPLSTVATAGRHEAAIARDKTSIRRAMWPCRHPR